jgi:hypothetical protein
MSRANNGPGEMVVEASPVVSGNKEDVDQNQQPSDVWDRRDKSGHSLPNEHEPAPVRNLTTFVIDDADTDSLFPNRLTALNQQVDLIPGHAETACNEQETTEGKLPVAIPGARTNDGSR